MTYGEKISKLRKSKNMTQKELGDALNVTYQAVSKWERDESLPDFETMVKLSKLFGVSITYFENSEAEEPDIYANNEAADQTEETAEPSTEQEEMRPEMIGVCTTCGRMLREGEEEPNQPKLLCKSCAQKARAKQAEEQKKAERIKQENQRAAQAAEAAEKERYNKRTILGCVIGGLVAIVALVSTIVTATQELYPTDALTIAGMVVSPIILFMWVFQLFWDGAVRTVASWGLVAIKMPGVIFTADLDGLKFLIVMKILLAILSWAITAFLLILAAFASMIVGIFSFIPLVIKVRNRNEDIMPV